ncbi:MAG: hypothetical protein A2Y03_10210 [Omnitrophica WOR_2 bacterium GWF2_38_59]|nr:MAG: hypothetical protein A2Y03_10210 [Omnitrophica WOR_2 bacterium GWF2_38_59]
MNKNEMYIAVFGVLCVLAGVIVGVGIAKKLNLPWSPGPQGPHFAERAEHFMGYSQKGPKDKRYGGGPLEMLSDRLSLNAEQKTKVSEILEKTRQEIDEVGKNVRNTIDEVREKSDKQIMDILTPQQQEKFKALQEEFKKGRGVKGPEGKNDFMRRHMPPPNEGFPPPSQ